MSTHDKSLKNEPVGAEVASFALSPQFDCVYEEGMRLVEAAAAYLDGAGRRQARKLHTSVSSAYATQSMRMTTRLLEVASWLLVQRALKSGEISAEDAERRRRKVQLRPSDRPSHIKHFDELPEQLRALISASVAISDRIMRIDQAISAGSNARASASVNPVEAQRSVIRTAFTVIEGGRR